MNRLTIEDFLQKAFVTHDNKYDYSLVVYINARTKVKIICKIHGIFNQLPKKHCNGTNCPKCVHPSEKYTKDIFKKRAVAVHGDKYDYSLVKYKKNSIKIKIICKIHGVFFQIPNGHLSGKGCKQCGIENNKKITTHTIEQFIKKAKDVHGDKYDYNNSHYVSAIKKIDINCLIHGIFKQKPNDHLSGYGCPKCAGRNKTKEEVVEKFNKIHNGKYEYNKFIYKFAKTKSIIVCNRHGEFLQNTNDHLSGYGCPKCNSSKGEEKIRQFLNQNNILFKEQMAFEECKNDRCLPFDFFLQDKNILIEYDGEQHFRPTKFSNAIKKFEATKKHDEIKNKFAEQNGIKLIRIPYTDFKNIENVLKENIL